MSDEPDTTRFSDAAPEPDEPQTTDAPDSADADLGDSGELVLADAAPGTQDELAEIGARQAAQDAADAERAEAQRAERQARRKAQYDPEISADRQEMLTAGTGEAGHAVCPSCQAKNAFDALRCARCGAEIPSAIPGAGASKGGRRYGTYKNHHERMREQEGEDAWDMLPEEKRHELEEAAERKEQRRLEAKARLRGFRDKIVAMSAGYCALLGLLTTAVALGASVAGGLALLLDLGAGAAAGYVIYLRRGGNRIGLLSFALVGVVCLGFKLAAGGIDVLLSGIPGAVCFLFFVANMGGLLIGGYIGGGSLEQEFVDDHS